jgi:hypothetical protein
VWMACWNSPRQKKVGQVKSQVKSMLIIFFDIKAILHKEFVLAGQTVNSAYYCGVLCRFRENVPRLRPKQLTVESWQCTVSRFLFHQGIFLTKTTWLLSKSYSTSVSPIENKTLKPPFLHNWGDLSRITGGGCWTPSQNTTSKMHLIHGWTANGA